MSVRSKHGVRIRLPEERWQHIVEEHAELEGYRAEVLRTVADPDAVYRGSRGELIAVREMEPGKHLVVVYREIDRKDGFIITAFLTRRPSWFERRQKLWP